MLLSLSAFVLLAVPKALAAAATHSYRRSGEAEERKMAHTLQVNGKRTEE
jgi:hypothetical protein